MALAFQTDSTRVSTFVLAHDGSDRSYPTAGVHEGHHTLSHHGNDETKKQKIATADVSLEAMRKTAERRPKEFMKVRATIAADFLKSADICRSLVQAASRITKKNIDRL